MKQLAHPIACVSSAWRSFTLRAISSHPANKADARRNCLRSLQTIHRKNTVQHCHPPYLDWCVRAHLSKPFDAALLPAPTAACIATVRTCSFAALGRPLPHCLTSQAAWWLAGWLAGWLASWLLVVTGWQVPLCVYDPAHSCSRYI